MNEKQFKALKSLLSQPKNIVIIGHKNPDGDAIGATLGLSLFLKNRGHHTQVICPNDFPNFLKWMPDCDSIITYDSQKEQSIEKIEEAHIIFTLDFNSLSRIGLLKDPLEKVTAPFVMIDHHQEPDDYATFIYSDTGMSSTCQMVYHFIELFDGISEITPKIATNLYTGIMTDTGSFRFPSTTAITHRVIADLIDKGAENTTIHQNIYDTNNPNRIKLLGIALKNLTVLPEYHTAYITLSKEELQENNFKKGDTEGFVNYGLSLTGIKFAAIFIESIKENIVKISFRSKGDFSVNDFSKNHFYGGGHLNAAGGRSDKPLKQTISNFISILSHYKKDLDNAL